MLPFAHILEHISVPAHELEIGHCGLPLACLIRGIVIDLKKHRADGKGIGIYIHPNRLFAIDI